MSSMRKFWLTKIEKCFFMWDVSFAFVGTDKIWGDIQQYTGLKDKNGKEIYEGDIVEAWSQGVKAKGEVKQRIDGYWLMFPAWQSGEFWTLAPNQNGETTVKVIGNIHENPELLGKE